MGDLRAVGFDLDGTLFDHEGAARAAAAQFITGLGLAATESALAAWSRAEDEQFERWRSGELTFAEQRRARLASVLPPLGYTPPRDDDGLDALFEVYLHRYRAAWRAVPGSTALLHELRTRGYRLGLLTNGTEEQQRDKLARIGLAEAFDAVCTSERIGHQKPDPRAFTTLAAELGVDPSACLFVGDDADKDVRGARSAGMRALLVDHRTGGPERVWTAVLGALPA